MKIIMTGGHHSSAMPVIKILKALKVEILWFGHRHSLAKDENDTLEYREITSEGIRFIELPTGKLYRNISVSSIVKIIKATYYSMQEIREFKPDIILSFGGYLAVPVVVAGWILGIKILTHEQTLISGYANRVIALFADKILVSWLESAKYFPTEKVVFSGIPLRDSIFKNNNDFVIDNNLPTILIMGGKTGSHIINMVIRDGLVKLLDKYNLIHQTGDYSEFKDYDELVKAHSFLKDHKGTYIVRKFLSESEVGSAYFCSNVVVCRAGAHTTLELLALKKKAIMIPIPWVSHNEQNLNASLVAESGLAIVLPEKNFNTETLIRELDMMTNEAASVKKDLYKNYPKDAEYRIVNQIRLVLKSEF